MMKNRTGNGSDNRRPGGARPHGAARHWAVRRQAAPCRAVSARATSKGGAVDLDAADARQSGAARGGANDSATSPVRGSSGKCSPVEDDHTSSGAEATHAAADDGDTTDQDAAPAIEAAQQIDQLSEQVATLQSELLRKQADFENSRKRLIRDKEEAIKFANSGLLLDLTGVLDDFERAISAAAQSREFTTLYGGIELIEKQLLGTLERKWGLSRFDSAGQPFDPGRHEALATEPSTEHTETTVLEDYQKGYLLHGRVIRAARVRVATPVGEPSDAAESASGDSDEGGTTG